MRREKAKPILTFWDDGGYDYRTDDRMFKQQVNAVESVLKRLGTASWGALSRALPDLHPDRISSALEYLQSQKKITVDVGNCLITKFHYGVVQVKSDNGEWIRARVLSNQGAKRRKAA